MFIVEMFRPYVAGAGERDLFDCPGTLWLRLGEVGMAFGWVPTGVEVGSIRTPFSEEVGWKNAYWPGTWGGLLPRVTDLDALQWAQALRNALRSMHALGVDLPHAGPAVFHMVGNEAIDAIANGGLTRAFLTAFLGYLERGGFTFAWDD